MMRILSGNPTRAAAGRGSWSRSPRSLVIPAALVLCAGAHLAAPGAARAQAACTVGFVQGEVTTGQALAAALPLGEATQACLRQVAAAAAKRPTLRSLTVVVRLPDADRKNGESLAIANAMSDILQAGGVPKRKLSVVAPAVGHDQDAGVKLLYSEPPRGRPIAKLVIVEGAVSGGADTAMLAPAAKGATLHAHDHLQTAAESRAVLALADGSTLDVRPSTLLRLGTIGLTAEYQRQVRVEVLRGSVQVTVAEAKPGSIFQMITRAAVAGVRGTRFRLAAEDSDQTRIETLTGAVALGNAAGQTDTAGGQGTRAAPDRAPEEARALLAPPARLAPLEGRFASAPDISWDAAPDAAAYVVELARNAQFTREVTWMTSRETSASFRPLAEGRWFWRVLPVDADGFVGMPSKIYSFVIDSTAAPAP